MQTATFAGSVVSAIDGFLDIAAGFFQNLAHLARHVRGVLLLVAHENLANAKHEFGSLRRRR